MSTLWLAGFEAPAAPPPVTPDTPLGEVTFVAFDTETTGLKPGDDRIVEIAAAKFTAGRLVERQCWLVNPGRAIPPEVQRIHGITDVMVSASPPFSRVYPDFVRFTDGCVLLAHNARFDRRFLAAEADRNRMPLPETPMLDSMPLFKTWYPRQYSYSLESLARHALPAVDRLPKPDAQDRTNRFHAAGWDSECLMALFLKGATNLPPAARMADLLKLTDGAYSLQHARRIWRPGHADQSSSSASAASLTP